MPFRSSLLSTAVFVLGFLLPLLLLASKPQAQEAPDGHKLFLENCATCHGETGHGDRRASDLGFAFKMPDFHDCSFATREADGDWASTIHRGGRARAFPRQMPAWDKALSDDEIDAIIGYLRSFCTASGYPRGEFNLPLAFFTEKAFVEDELVNITEFNAAGPAGYTSSTIFEKRFGKTGQIEVNLPFASAFDGTRMRSGLGDIALGWKQNLLADVESGTIVSLLGETVLPTGNARRGLGSGVWGFETQALFAKLLPGDFFLQGQVGTVFSTGLGVPVEGEARFALGRTFAEDDGYGRSWTPQLELLTAHEFARGAGTDFDLVPQLQVSISRRQHILMSLGGRIPLNDTLNRKPSVMVYLIWDWYDAGFLDGWRNTP